MADTAVAIKPNGAVQRADVALTPEIARALVQRVLEGENLYPPSRELTLTIGGEETKLSTNTLDTWCRRANVVPDSGKTLKALLDEARANYRTKKVEEQRKTLVSDTERVFKRTLNVQTNVARRDKEGNIVLDPETGQPVRYENPKILAVKLDAAKFVAERLAPDVYGKVERGVHKHLVFSLTDLRKAKEARDAAQTDA